MRTPNRFSHICEFLKNLKNLKKQELVFLKDLPGRQLASP
jgi:hypothetical protein